MIWTGLLVGFLVTIGFFSQPVYANFCSVDVTSSPPGAKVYIDGEYKGDAPVFHTFGNPTLAEIVVKKEGYKEWKKSINVPLDEIVQVEAELEPVKGEEAPPPGKTPPAEEAKAKPGEKGMCGPTALLVLVMLPLGMRKLL